MSLDKVSHGLAEGVRFELTREQNPLPVFKTGALNHSATLPARLRLALVDIKVLKAFSTYCPMRHGRAVFPSS